MIAARRPAARGLRRRGGRVERPELHRAAPRRRWRPSAGTCSIRARSRARSWVASPRSSGGAGPVVAATDYMRSFADQIRPWVDAPYRVLGTDGYGRSDYRKTLRSFFEVDRHHVVLAALRALGPTTDARSRRSSTTTSTPNGRAMAGVREADVAGTEQVLVPDIGDFERRAGHRGPRRGRRRGRRRRPARRARVRQGDDGGPVAGGRARSAKIKVAVGDKVKEGTRSCRSR